MQTRRFSAITLLLFALLLAVISACSAPLESPTPTAVRITATLTPPSPTATLAPSSTPTPRPTSTPDADAVVCSPLEGITLAQLTEIVSNPLVTPVPGLDDGHHGVDFAFYRFGERTTMRGLPVYSVMEGTVAAVVQNRTPYGNMIIVETPLELLSAGQVSDLNLPAVIPTIQPHPAMTCPTNEETASPIAGRSLYFLYAHMESASRLKVGDSVTCGAALGGVGTTGMSVNDHLHLEARIGPARQRFNGMAFYDTGATAEEMANYCRWRASQTFQLLDPLKTLLTIENQ